MSSDSTVERHAAITASFLAALADAAGDVDAAGRYVDSMIRAWLLLKPVGATLLCDHELTAKHEEG